MSCVGNCYVLQQGISCTIWPNSCKIAHTVLTNIRDEFFKRKRSQYTRIRKISLSMNCVRLTKLNKYTTYVSYE